MSHSLGIPSTIGIIVEGDSWKNQFKNNKLQAKKVGHVKSKANLNSTPTKYDSRRREKRKTNYESRLWLHRIHSSRSGESTSLRNIGTHLTLPYISTEEILNEIMNQNVEDDLISYCPEPEFANAFSSSTS